MTGTSVVVMTVVVLMAVLKTLPLLVLRLLGVITVVLHKMLIRIRCMHYWGVFVRRLCPLVVEALVVTLVVLNVAVVFIGMDGDCVVDNNDFF